MEIEVSRLSALQITNESTPPVVAASEITAFSDALFGKSGSTPEISAISHLQSKSLSVTDAITTAQESLLDSPVNMLTAQSKMLHTLVEVDLIAKTTGALAQGVNKLVSMQ